MTTNRRDFLKQSAVAAGAIAVGGATSGAARAAAQSSPRAATDAGRAPKPLRILILGGTGQTGPFQVKYAVERGHQVTVFNRGRHQADLPASVVHLTGDRNTHDLAALKGKEWDVVIDNPTSLPFWVRDAGQVLKDHTKQYIFISTISVYDEQPGAPDVLETSPLAKYKGADPLAETMDSFRKNVGELYGPLKAASEAEAEKWFPKRTTVIRPGLIVGPRDESGRFTYWPVRIEEGGEVLAPGTPNDPVEFIDGRDLAEWTIRMAETGTTGIFNATGLRTPVGMAEMLHGIKAVTTSDARFTWVETPFLAANNVQPWSDMPVWIPPGEGLGHVHVDRAQAAGLTYRPLAVTARDTLDWYHAQPADAQARLRGPFPRTREREVLAAWHAKK